MLAPRMAEDTDRVSTDGTSEVSASPQRRTEADDGASDSGDSYLHWAQETNPAFERDYTRFVERAAAHAEAKGLDVDPVCNSRENARLRRRLKADPQVVATIRRFWNVVDLAKDESGRVRRQPYLEMNCRLQKALTPEESFDPEAALAQARRDWLHDMRPGGESDLSRPLTGSAAAAAADAAASGGGDGEGDARSMGWGRFRDRCAGHEHAGTLTRYVPLPLPFRTMPLPSRAPLCCGVTRISCPFSPPWA